MPPYRISIISPYVVWEQHVAFRTIFLRLRLNNHHKFKITIKCHWPFPDPALNVNYFSNRTPRHLFPIYKIYGVKSALLNYITAKNGLRFSVYSFCHKWSKIVHPKIFCWKLAWNLKLISSFEKHEGFPLPDPLPYFCKIGQLEVKQKNGKIFAGSVSQFSMYHPPSVIFNSVQYWL